MEIELLPIPQTLSVEETLPLVPFQEYLNLSPTEINALCLQDRSMLDTFNKLEFWQSYFSKRKLTLLETGSHPASWSTIFRKSRDSCQVTNFLFAKVFPHSTLLEYELKGEENPEHFTKFVNLGKALPESTFLLKDSLVKKVFLRLSLAQREKKPFSFTSLNMFNMCRDESKIFFTLTFTKKGSYLASFSELVNRDAKNNIAQQELTPDQAKKLALNVFYFYICT